MRSGGNILNYFTENQLTKFSVVCEMFSLEFGHTLSVGLLVRPWPYRPYRRRRPCTFKMRLILKHWSNCDQTLVTDLGQSPGPPSNSTHAPAYSQYNTNHAV